MSNSMMKRLVALEDLAEDFLTPSSGDSIMKRISNLEVLVLDPIIPPSEPAVVVEGAPDRYGYDLVGIPRDNEDAGVVDFATGTTEITLTRHSSGGSGQNSPYWEFTVEPGTYRFADTIEVKFNNDTGYECDIMATNGVDDVIYAITYGDATAPDTYSSPVEYVDLVTSTYGTREDTLLTVTDDKIYVSLGCGGLLDDSTSCTIKGVALELVP